MNTTELMFFNYSVEHKSTLKYPFHKSKASIIVTMDFEQILLPTKQKKNKTEKQSKQNTHTHNHEFWILPENLTDNLKNPAKYKEPDTKSDHWERSGAREE